MATIRIDETLHKVVEIRATGDVILDVTFENTNACTKSIPADALQKLRASKMPIPSPRIFYRVRLDTLKKQSKYFLHLLGSDVFGEGRSINEAFTKLAETNLNPTEIDAEMLPRISIVDEMDATASYGREAVFHDFLRIIHGADILNKSLSILYITILVVMADRFDCMAPISRYITSKMASFRYPQTLDKKAEETLRMKLLIFYHTNQAARLLSATKELVLRGSTAWVEYDERSPGFTTAWWDLPEDLEGELSHRRMCILRTIASLQTHFIELYTSRTQQCTLGYDSSPSCDSFQLGEMIRFLTKKNLLSLVPFQSCSPEDPDYIWPEPYTGEVEHLIGLLRQCPSYQIDKNHSHCGLRTKILPALDYIRDCMDTGIGIKVQRWKTDRSSQTWIIPKAASHPGRKPFEVAGKIGAVDTRIFDFTKAKQADMGLGANSINIDQSAKSLFTAEKWYWTADPDDVTLRSAKSAWKF